MKEKLEGSEEEKNYVKGKLDELNNIYSSLENKYGAALGQIQDLSKQVGAGNAQIRLLQERIEELRNQPTIQPNPTDVQINQDQKSLYVRGGPGPGLDCPGSIDGG